MVLGKVTLFAFRDVAVIPEVGRLYALSVAPITDRFQLPVPECKQGAFARYHAPLAYVDTSSVKLLCTLQYAL